MAPVLEKRHPGAAGTGENNNEDEEGQNLWSSILSEVSTRSSSKLPSGKNILVFGEDGSGKTTLMAKLQGAEHNKKGRGLEYLYLSVHDEDRDDLTRCNVWILDGDLYHKGLLKFAVSAQSLSDCLAVFVVDMSRPWIIMDSLQKWSSVLRDHVDKLKIEPDVLREMEQRKPVYAAEDQTAKVPAFGRYPTHNAPDPLAPPAGGEPTGRGSRVAFSGCARPDSMGRGPATRPPYPQAWLQEGPPDHGWPYQGHKAPDNGAPRIIGTRKPLHHDKVVAQEGNNDMVKAFQEYSEPEDANSSSPQRRAPTAGEDEAVVLPLGENTLTHNLGVPCDAVSVLEKEHDYKEEQFDFIQSHIRSPSGWDNEKKIAILHENLSTVRPEDPFEDFITKPPVRKLVHDKEINAEDEQVFLMKQQSLLAKQPVTPTRGAAVRLSGTDNLRITQARWTCRPNDGDRGSPMASVKKPDPNIKAGAASEGVLANFFNSLLSKKTGSPGSPGSGAVGAGVQGSAKKTGQKPGLTDVQAELDRMTRKHDSMVSANNVSPPTENEA
ncbi:Cytoplasmic dynein 1 light intermediate chain 2 [Takifugu flavidus]|uniref:Dynein light intermediate chain n=1 Tax=Takifugu flavidus TaxID=433684 RepID=A0A5C6NL69_9TELE|nr:Cytoplasmic dynein 1 light intermediate chain 2 [Takifugu flavidus]